MTKKAYLINRLIPGAAVVLFMFLITACRKDPGNHVHPIHKTTPYDLEVPERFPPPDIPKDNPMTQEGVKLGRHLYYEPLLSKGGPQEGNSCSSCHQQKDGFSTPGTNVLPHLNLAWSRAFLWKGGVKGGLEEAMHFEVADFFQADLDHLRKTQKYPGLYEAAFGTEKITTERTTKALAQFLRTVISADSKFDRYLRGEVSLTPSEANGLNIFNSEKGDCFHCHNLTLFTDGEFHNIGLDSTFSGEDRGRFLVTGDSADIGKFKTPTLRNAELRPPYMHDGRFETLAEVVEHYNSGVKPSRTLAPVMSKDQDLKLHLTPQEKKDLVAFLKTLTDTVCTSKEEFGEP